MAALAIIGLIVGATLGSRFKVLILVPVSLTLCVAVAATTYRSGMDQWLVMAIISTVAFEFGYVAATLIRCAAVTDAAVAFAHRTGPDLRSNILALRLPAAPRRH